MINVVRCRRVAAVTDPINLPFFLFCNGQERTRGKADPCNSKPPRARAPSPSYCRIGETILEPQDASAT